MAILKSHNRAKLTIYHRYFHVYGVPETPKTMMHVPREYSHRTQSQATNAHIGRSSSKQGNRSRKHATHYRSYLRENVSGPPKKRDHELAPKD